MKLLRILTGRHAGAQLRLNRREMRIGRDADADVHISDWKHDAITLTIEEGQPVTLTALSPRSDANGTPALVPVPLGEMLDFVPRSFKDVALCIGPVQAQWPADMELVRRLLKSSPVERAAQRMAQRRALVGGVAVGALLLAGTAGLLVHLSGSAHAQAPRAQALNVRVQQRLAAEQVAGLTVTAAGSQVVVEGLLAHAADVARVRSALASFGSEPVVHRYAAAADVAQSIADALGASELEVRYRGEGVFTVSGQVADLKKLTSAVHTVSADLGSMVKHIELDVTERPAPQTVPVGSMLSSNGVEYVQTRDGTKHLSLPPSSTR